MPQNRYYFPGALTPGSQLTLKDDEFHYLKNVMRSGVGQMVEVINGNGFLASCEISKMTRDEAHLIATTAHFEEPPSRSVHLAVAILKPSHLEYAIEKACELGAASFMVYPASRSEKKALSEQYLKRLYTIILSSTKQCGRLYLPQLICKNKLDDALEGEVVFGDLESAQSLAQHTLGQNLTLVVGPESGFTPQEREKLLQKGAKGILLHKNTLRAETACAVGIALLTQNS